MSRRSYIISAVFGAASAIGVWSFYGALPDPKLLRDVADSLAGVTGTLAGFLLTCISIVIAVTPGQTAMSELKRIGTLGSLVRRSGASVAALVLASVFAAVARVADSTALQAFAALTAMLATFGLMMLASAGREYLRIFGYLSSSRPTR